jgi:uncharacterized protein (TIGR02271 family)
MTNTIVGYFEDYNEARRAEQDLIDSGFSGDVQVVRQNADGMEMSQGSQRENWWDQVKSAFGFANERELGHYREATQRGGTLLTVRVRDEQTDEAAAILERHHPVDLDTRVSSWQSEGRSTLTGTGVSTLDTSAVGRTSVDSEETVQLAEEQLQVGKRAVQRGALRVHTYVTERPVEEQVSLREAEAYVDRRPVDRAATAGEGAFQERTIEVQEVGEEAVVSKQARVVEEVSIGTKETSRTETVRDTVRKTEVEVEHDDRLGKSRK